MKLSPCGGVHSLMKTHIPRNNRTNRILLTAVTALALTVPVSLFLAQGSSPSTGNSQGNQHGGQQRPHGGPHLLPPHAAETLNLTDEQKQQLKELEADVKSKIESILTPAQMEQLKQMRPQHPPGGGGGAPREGASEGGSQSQSTNQPAS